MDILYRLFNMNSSNVPTISTKDLVISIIVVLVVFFVLLKKKSNVGITTIEVPVVITAFAFMAIFIGKIIQWFEPQIGYAIMQKSIWVFVGCIAICYYIYTTYFLKGILNKLIAYDIGAAIIMQFMGWISLRNIFLFALVGLAIIKMIKAFIKA